MQAFPQSLFEPSEADRRPQLRLDIYRQAFTNDIPNGKTFTCEDREIIRELLVRFPSTLQVQDDAVSGLDNRPTGEKLWIGVNLRTVDPGPWANLPRPHTFRIVQ